MRALEARRPRGAQAPRGFTLIETMIALTVLLIASIGVVTSLIAASKQLRYGQFRQYQLALTDASVQRIRLQSKQGLYNQAAASPGTWAVDSSLIPTETPTSLEVGAGAYFTVLPDGTIQRPTIAIPPGTACSQLPVNIYCREVLLMAGPPNYAVIDPTNVHTHPVSPTINPANGTELFTYSVRVSHIPAPGVGAVVDAVQTEVIAL